MKKPFLQAVADGGLVGDGAMGSLLYEAGVYVNRNFDEVNIQQPELVYKLHRKYLLAGAHILESNTYGANRIRLMRHGLASRTEEINRAAVDIMQRAAGGAAYLAGSIGPSGLSPGETRRGEKDVSDAFSEQAAILADAGCDVLIIETFAHPPELRLAVEAARAAVEIPIVAQVQVNGQGHILDGTNALDLAHEMRSWGADVVGVNCNGPEVIYEVAMRMVESGLPVCAMPNAGRPQNVEDRLIYLATPENFGVYARRMFKGGVKIVGGCCGTNPSHISRVASAARMVWPRRRPQAHEKIEMLDGAKPPLPVEQRSGFGAKLGQKFVVSVEVNPHGGLNTEKPVQAAHTLIKAGADIINIADGPRATARMSNLALACQMQEQLGIETLLHVCCRDRNLLGLQAHVMGAHVLGIRNLVVITGDPPKVGDYPDATAVYDVDSIGLLRMVDGLNRGVDPSGRSTDQTSFVLATGAEPAATDFDREILRLRQKVDAGANLIMTQPVYDPDTLERFLKATQDWNVPILVGLLPLASYRNAEFVHNNIPGMQIPENIRQRMRLAGKGESARQEGVNITLEALQSLRQRVSGAYIMPPLGRYDMAVSIIEALGSDRTLAPQVQQKPGAQAG